MNVPLRSSSTEAATWIRQPRAQTGDTTDFIVYRKTANQDGSRTGSVWTIPAVSRNPLGRRYRKRKRPALWPR